MLLRGHLNVASWLQADMRPPGIEVCSTPNSGHSEAHAGLPVLTQAVSKLFSGGRNEILIREVGLRRNDDSPTLPSESNYCAEGLDLGVLTQPGPIAEVDDTCFTCYIGGESAQPDPFARPYCAAFSRRGG